MSVLLCVMMMIMRDFPKREALKGNKRSRYPKEQLLYIFDDN